MSTSTLVEPFLPPNTIVPINEDLFIPYFTNLYEEIANAVNSKDLNFYPVSITSIATLIPNLPLFGAYIICVSGSQQDPDGSWPPTITASLCESAQGTAGSVAVLGSQAGQPNAAGGGQWSAATLTIGATAGGFTINHSVAGATGSFNIRIIGTQTGV